MGSIFFEKHFTLDCNSNGPDHWFSADPQELKKWVSSIRIAYTMLGTSEVKPTKNEEKIKVLARRSIIALDDIKSKVVMIDFWASWCAPCKMIAPILEEISNEMGDKITIAKHNIDDFPSVPVKYNIRGIPTMLIFSKSELNFLMSIFFVNDASKYMPKRPLMTF